MKHQINEGSDWILLSSIDKLIDSWDGYLMNTDNPMRSPEILPKSKQWKTLYTKASTTDKKTMDSIIKSMSESVNEAVGSKDKPFLPISKNDYAQLSSKGKFTASKLGTKFSHRPSPAIYKQYPEGLKFVTIKNPNTNQVETIKVKNVEHTDSAIYIDLVKEALDLKSLEPINGVYSFNTLSKMSDMGKITKITKKIFDDIVEKLKKAGADVLTANDDKLYTIFSYGDNYNLVQLKENINEAKYNSKDDAMNAYMRGKIDAKELQRIAHDDFGTQIATKKELNDFLSNKFLQGLMANTYDLTAPQMVKKVKTLLPLVEEYTGNIGDKLVHKHDPSISIELLDTTNKGWKVKQTITKGNRSKSKIAYYDKQDIQGNKSLFESLNETQYDVVISELFGGKFIIYFISDKARKFAKKYNVHRTSKSGYPITTKPKKELSNFLQMMKKIGFSVDSYTDRYNKTVTENTRFGKWLATRKDESKTINESDEFTLAQKLFKQASGNEIKFYDELQTLHDKMGHPKYMKFISMALKSHGVDMFRNPKIKNPAEAEEYLYNLLKSK